MASGPLVGKARRGVAGFPESAKYASQLAARDFFRGVTVRPIGKLLEVAGPKVSDSIPNLTNLYCLAEIYLSIMLFSFHKCPSEIVQAAV